MKRRQVLTAMAMSPLLSALTPARADSGSELDLSAHQGKVVMVDFWASWCGPCRQSFPWLNKMSAKYESQGLHIIGVNLDAESELAKQFLTEIPAEFEIMFDPEGNYASYYKLKAMPTSLLFDRSGKIASRHNGFLTDDTAEYETKLLSLLTA